MSKIQCQTEYLASNGDNIKSLKSVAFGERGLLVLGRIRTTEKSRRVDQTMRKGALLGTMLLGGPATSHCTMASREGPYGVRVRKGRGPCGAG